MRDPTRNPQVGDRVYGAGESRRVISRAGEIVTYVADNGDKERSFSCWILSWRTWCRSKNVEVIERAEEE